MAMTIMNNTGAEIAISAFNQSIKQADKSLVKLSSGQKFKNANEDTAGYSMSEKMIEKIRALFQDDQNIQNGSSMDCRELAHHEGFGYRRRQRQQH